MTFYRKHFIPLESNPEVFNNLINLLGIPLSLTFEDVLSLDEPLLLPRPALALILVLPTTESYERRKSEEDALHKDFSYGVDDDIVWFKQTINNACGLYAILHALCNGVARDILETNVLITTLIKAGSPLTPDESSLVLENSTELENAYAEVAAQGTSTAPDDAHDEVDFHYVCFVKSYKSGRLYELDGDRKGPIDRGVVLGPEEDVLAPVGRDIIRQYMEREGGATKFSLMALVYRE